MPSTTVISPTATGPSSRQPRICTRLGVDRANMASAISPAAASLIGLTSLPPEGGILIYCHIHMNHIAYSATAPQQAPALADTYDTGASCAPEYLKGGGPGYSRCCPGRFPAGSVA